MDGAASTQPSAEEEPSGDAVDLESCVSAAPAMREPEEEGYLDSMVRATLLLLRKDLPLKVRRHGLKMMQHLLRFRWDELRITEWSAFGDAADLIAGLGGTPNLLPSKSATAALMAEVIWSGGISLLNDFIPSLTALSKRGPIEAELVAFILKWISDFRIVCTADLEGLYGLDEFLPNIMLLLSSLLGKHGERTLAEHSDQLMISTEKHVLIVTAGLLAANAYAEWVPVVHLAKHGLIERCESLLHFSHSRMHALQFFKVICQRRRPCTVAKDYDAAMSHVFQILMSISQDSLTKSKACCDFVDERELDFAERICECLVSLGSINMQCIIADGIRTSRFLQQMLEYYQHDKIALHFRCLPFWLLVLTELHKENCMAPDPGDVASAVNSASGANSTKTGNIGALFFVSDEICSAILDVSFKRMLKTSATTSPESLELWSDELHGKNDFIQYRSRLLDLIRCIAHQRPIVAASRAAQRINTVIGDASTVSKSPKDFDAIESAQQGLETVVDAIFDDSVGNGEIILDTKFPMQMIYKIFGGLLAQLISLKWTEPRLAVILGNYLNALCPYLSRCPNAVAAVMDKLFELLSSIIVNCHDPSKDQNAKLQICSCVIHICQAVDATALPSDMKDFFSLPCITEEDVLAFCALNRTTYSAEQNQVGRGNEDGDSIQFSASNTMPSPQISDQTLALQPWALKGEKMGLSLALSCLQDLPNIQPSSDSCSDLSCPKSNLFSSLFGWFGKRSSYKHQFYVNDCTLNPKNTDHSLLLDPQLYSPSFPLHGSVPISWLGLGTKSQIKNGRKSLNISLESQISTESCRSCSLACTCSPGIVHSCFSLATQRQKPHGNGELQTYVTSVTQVVDDIDKHGVESPPINKFDGGGQVNDQEYNTVQINVTGDVEGPAKSSELLGIDEAMSCHQGKGELLLGEHNLLSEALITVTSFPGIQYKKQLLMYLLNALNKIWTQPEWEQEYMHYSYCLSGLFSNDQFVRTAPSLVKSFEEELIGNKIEESAGTQEECSSTSTTNYLYSSTFPQLMLPLLLRMLDCIHKLWTQPIAYNLSEIIKIAKIMSSEEISNFLEENNQLSDVDEARILRAKTIGTCLCGIRETGYNVIGLCASVNGAFFGLLNSSLIINTLVGNLRSMEFHHLGKLIQLVFIPLVKYCPHECWDNWMVDLLESLFSHCENVFCYAWFSLIHEGRAKVPAYFGDLSGPEEEVKKLEMQLLLKFTHSVSDLLGVLASEGLNSGLLHLNPRQIDNTESGFQDLKSMSSSSLVGYLLLHNCFGRLSMYLFGCLVDYQAAKKALPFCRALIRLAGVTNDERLKQFIFDEMLPTVIRLLGGDLQSAISRLSLMLNSSINVDDKEDLVCLCQEIYEVYLHNQVMVGEGVYRKNIGGFDDWLATELECLHTRASCAAPEDFPKDIVWNWEFNEEFESHLSDYMNMLLELDAMDDRLERTYLYGESLDKLKPDFMSRYDSCQHPYLRTMTSMLERKMSAVYYPRCCDRIYKFLIQLITLKPYIKRTDCWDNVMDRLEENCNSDFDLVQYDAARAVDIFCNSILFYWEPQFHPLIREAHMELLKTIARQLTLAEESKLFEPLEPDSDDFLEHLQPYAWTYIKRKKEESGYYRAKEQVRLHEEFDNHLASGTLDHCMDEFSSSKDEFVQKVVGSYSENSQFAKLDHDLIKMSFERRARIVEWEHQISSYSRCLRALLENDEMKDELESSMSLLDVEGFFRVNDDSIDWDKKLFSDLVDKFTDFSGHCLDKCYTIRGMMDFREILQRKDVTWHDAFGMVVGYATNMWKRNLQRFWMDTRHYEHDYYDMLRQPLKKVFV